MLNTFSQNTVIIQEAMKIVQHWFKTSDLGKILHLEHFLILHVCLAQISVLPPHLAFHCPQDFVDSGNRIYLQIVIH